MIARFARGGTKFDLASSPFALADFVPPAVSGQYSFTAGNSLNRYGGSELLSEVYENRQLNFHVRARSTSEGGAMRHAQRLAAYLKTKSIEPLYFEFQPLDVPEPSWGQFGAPLRYEVVAADCSVGGEYNDARLRAAVVILAVTLEIKPLALGKQQRLASALGGVWLDTLGSATGEPWGLRVPEGKTEKITNNVFSSTTAWNNNWNASGVTARQQIEAQYCFPGATSAAYIANNGASAGTYTININAGNTNKHSFSMMVRRPDGEAVTASDCQIYYNAAKTSTYQALGNGWYLVYADNIDGINSSTATGISVAAGRGVILACISMEEKAYHTALGHGDMLGWSWSGTAFDSTATRVAGRVSITTDTDTYNIDILSAHIVWKPDYANTASGDRYLFSTGGSNLRCYFLASDDKIYINDNTNSASTAALTFSAGDVLEILATAGNSGLAVYVKNHTTGTTYSGTNANFATGGVSSPVYIGSDASAANQAGGIFQLFEIYPDDLTSAQNTALQTALGPTCAAGYRAGEIPLFWCKDGDKVLDNCDDSTRDNWGVALGIPGNLPADTEWTITPSVVNLGGYWLMQSAIPPDRFILPDRQLNYVEKSGTVDAGCSGGEYLQETFTTKSTLGGNGFIRPDLVAGKTVHHFARIKRVAGETVVTCYPGWYYSYATTPAEAPSKNITIGASFLFYYLGSTVIEVDPALEVERNRMLLGCSLYAAAATSTTIGIDYYMFIPGRAAYIINPGAATGWTSMLVRGRFATGLNATLGPYKAMDIRGDVVELDGGMCNVIWFVLAADAGAHTITDTATMTTIRITPRYVLL